MESHPTHVCGIKIALIQSFSRRGPEPKIFEDKYKIVFHFQNKLPTLPPMLLQVH